MTPDLLIYHGDDPAADWLADDIDTAWSMAAHLCKLGRYHLRAYLGWGKAYQRGLVTELELSGYLRRYEQADQLGISWRGYFNDCAISRA